MRVEVISKIKSRPYPLLENSSVCGRAKFLSVLLNHEPDGRYVMKGKCMKDPLVRSNSALSILWIQRMIPRHIGKIVHRHRDSLGSRLWWEREKQQPKGYQFENQARGASTG